jgi:hyaluronoglucosaminidase
MPRINDDGTLVNGGVPQAGNLTAHLEKFAADAAALLPLGPLTEGACLLDWEFWRAEWATTGDAYRNASIARAAAQMPGAPPAAVLAAARAEYEAGARAFYEGSLRAFAAWYPLCAAGLYAYPANDWSNGGYNGPAGDAMRAQNDALDWLWAASGAIFPVVYLTSPSVSKYDNQTTAAYVASTVDEGMRCAARATLRRPATRTRRWSTCTRC